VRGSRPQQCENPIIANTSSMTHCSYRYHALNRCGCPDLDPNKNEKLWGTYVAAVINAVKLRLHQSEIVLTIFASGYLLQDCELLDLLFMDPTVQNWKGILKLQFVDLKYKVNDIKKLKEEVNKVKNLKVNWTVMVPAIVVGICGATSTIYGIATKEDDKSKCKVIVVGIMLIVIALILGGASLENQNDQVSEFEVNNPIMETIDQFLEQIEQQTPFKIHTDFFPNAESCIAKNNKCDVALGYDIENTFEIFEDLRRNNLKTEGEAILVTKEEDKSKTVHKILRRAHGNVESYSQQFFD